MSEELNIAPQQAWQQTAQTLAALSRILAKIAPGVTQLELTLAVELCRAKGYGSELPESILEKSFKHVDSATFLSREEFAKKQQESIQKP
ncbi:hypothetical protein Q7O60_16045 [Pseudomonas protegens]|uniref:hypothetical protein n=1 Tax=Pseudomonas protegens TaxID=380021 RepID=UPI0027473EB8|nr:hypothetical protein [Pseudomonas protegens]MDP9504508.1 hypothetical protein [Pseudomonas protegens]